jgi:hypothetical protein
MNEDLARPGGLVPGYAGHADPQARYLSDQQVRASVGEMLAGLRERLPSDGLRDELEALLLRCEFGDQHVIRAIEDDRFGKPELVELVEACDRKVVEAADRVNTAEADALPAALAALAQAFDDRSAQIEARLER